MSTIKDAIASTKEQFHDIQEGIAVVNTAVKATVEMPLLGLERYVAVARTSYQDFDPFGGPAPKQVLVSTRQGLSNLTEFQKEAFQHLRTAWKPVYDAAGDVARERTASAKRHADRIADTIGQRVGRHGVTDAPAGKAKKATAKA